MGEGEVGHVDRFVSDVTSRAVVEQFLSDLKLAVFIDF